MNPTMAAWDKNSMMNPSLQWQIDLSHRIKIRKLLVSLAEDEDEPEEAESSLCDPGKECGGKR